MSEKNTMHIYEKLAEMQNILRATKIKKSGKNTHNRSEYHTLGDLLPPVQIACERLNVLTFFDFPYDAEVMRDKAELHLINLDNREEHLVFNVPYPELEKLNNGINIMQSEGAYITYLKRYLLIDTFQLNEEEVIDALESTDEVITNSSRGIVIEEKPSCLNKVIEECHKLYSEEECDVKLLNKVSLKLLKEKKITKNERKEIFEYLKNK